MLKSVFICAFVIANCLACEDSGSFCKNIETATKCNKIDTCIKNVWNKIGKTNNKDSDVCQFCEQVITTVRNAITNAETEKTIEQYLQNACKIIPDVQLSSQCSNIMNNYLPQVFQLLKSYLNPQQICTAIGICTSSKNIKLNNEKVIDLIQPRLRLLPVFDKRKHSTISYLVSNTNDKICDDCKKIITDIEAMINEPETEQKIEEIIQDNLCNLLGNLASACDDMVKQYVPMIFDLLKAEIQPVSVCSAMGLCTAGDHTILPKMKLKTSALYEHALNLQNEKVCSVCTNVFQTIKNIDETPFIQRAIKIAIESSLCTKLGPFESECKMVVETYSSALFDLISNEINPENICKAIGFCSKPVDNSLNAIRLNMKPENPNVLTKKLHSNAECVLCEYVMDKLEDLIDSKSSEEEIIAALDKVCSILPDTISSQCKDFINLYGKALVKLIMTELNPKMICGSLGLCSTGTVEKIKLTNEMCPVCETLMQYLASMLSKNATIAEIETVLDKVCNFLPTNLKTECDNVVAQYGPLIVQLIASKLNPNEICAKIGLCTTRSDLKVKLSNDLCPVCETLMQYLTSMLSKNASIAEIEALLDKVCNFLPSNLKTECDNLVTQYGPLIVKLIASEIDPDEICAKIGLCSLNNHKLQPKHLLGEKECTYGPSFWCTSKENAIKCKALDHCIRVGWKTD